MVVRVPFRLTTARPAFRVKHKYFSNPVYMRMSVAEDGFDLALSLAERCPWIFFLRHRRSTLFLQQHQHFFILVQPRKQPLALL